VWGEVEDEEDQVAQIASFSTERENMMVLANLALIVTTFAVA
jgi:hypothetical protein